MGGMMGIKNKINSSICFFILVVWRDVLFFRISSLLF